MGWFWDKQPPSVRWAPVHTDAMAFSIREEMRGRGWKVLCLTWQMTRKMTTRPSRVRPTRVHAHRHTLPTNLFEKWQKFHTVITQLAAVISLFLIRASHRQTTVCVRAAETHAPFYPADKSTKKSFQRTAESYKTSGVSTKQTAFLVVMKLQQPALMNTNTGMLDPKINAHMGVILASKPVRSVLSREPHAPLLLHYGVFLM